MSERDDCGADAAAYVLGALDDREAERFRAHLERCVICRDEVATLQSVVESLPLAAPSVAMPRGLKRRLMREVRAARPRRLPGLPRLGPALAGAAALALAAGSFAAGELTGGTAGPRIVPARVLAATGTAFVRMGGGHAELVVRNMPAPPSDKIYEVWLKRPNRAPSPTSALFDVTASGSAAVDVPADLRGVGEVLVTPEPLGGSAVPTSAPVIEASLRSS
jgi:anti-sigma factor RsiW